MSLTFQLGIDSSTAVTIQPNFDYSDGKKQIRSDHRTKGGKAYSYKWGDYRQITFSTAYVPASTAALVNSWWDSKAELLWFITVGGVTEVQSVMLMNEETPLQERSFPYVDRYQGEIRLEGY